MKRTSQTKRAIREPRQLAQLWTDTRETPKLRKPTVVQFPVNDVCNSRCQMCFIWEQKKGRELTPDEVRKVFSSSLFSEVTHVGFNGGEPTLRNDLPDLVQEVIQTLPRIKAVNIITNAIQRDRVIERIAEIHSVASAKGVEFDVMVSLDGVGEVHDQVRGKPGNFVNAEAVIEAVRRQHLADSIRIGCTLTSTNARHGEELLEWALERDIYARFRMAVPHGRLYNLDRVNQFAVVGPEKFAVLMLLDRLIGDYERDPERIEFYRSLKSQLAYGSERTAGCAWRNHGVTLLSDGGLAYCAVESPRLGSAVEQDPDEVYWRGDSVRLGILEDKCAGCMHDYEGPSTFGTALKSRLPGMFIVDALQKWSKLSASAIRENSAWRRGQRTRPSRSSRGDSLILTGWYGTETVGDQAILAGLLPVVQSQHDGPTVIASLAPYVTRRTLEVVCPDAQDITVVDYATARTLVIEGQARAVAMAGGPLMGAVREIREVSELHRTAFERSVPTGLLGVGIGPVGSGFPRRLIDHVLRNADVVTVRDGVSLAYARSIGAQRSTQATDPALLWLANQRKAPDASEDGIALSVRDWPIHEYGRGTTVESDRRRLKTVLSEAVSSLGSRHRLKPIPMGFVNTGGDDRRVLRGLLGSESSPETKLIAYPSPQSISETILSSQAVLAMRFHAALFGLALGRPTVAIDYTLGGKLTSLAQQFHNVALLDPLTTTASEIEAALETAEAVDSGLVDTAVASTARVLIDAVDRLLS